MSIDTSNLITTRRPRPVERSEPDGLISSPVSGDSGAETEAVFPDSRVTPAPASSLQPPPTTQPWRVRWRYVIGVGMVHLLAMLALLPWLFSWTGVVLCMVGIYFYGTLGINLCYHRLLTHRGLTLPRWMERCLAVQGVCCLQDTPARWVAIHRMHHQHSDEETDPHSPLVNLLWGHFGWLMVENRDFETVNNFERYARDILRDPFYLGLERKIMWLWIYLGHAALYFLAGFLVGSFGGGLQAGLQFGASLVVWGIYLRTVIVWHITWSVNSLSHVFGYQNYETRDQSRNNWFVALISNGEGWHNNHHWDQRCAAHGHRWWEFDITYITIRILERLGLATDVAKPR